MTLIADVDPNFEPDNCPQEPIKLYVGGESLNPNNLVAEVHSISEFVHGTQPNDRRRLNLENVNGIIHDDFNGITTGDPTMRNVAPFNMSFPPPDSRYMSRVNLFACSSSLDNENSHSNSNNLPSMEVVGDSDGLMGKKLFSSKKELQKVLYMEALKKTFEFQTFKSRRIDLLLGVLMIIVSGDSMLLSLEVRICLKSESTITSSIVAHFMFVRKIIITLHLSLSHKRFVTSLMMLHSHIGPMISEKISRNSLGMK